MTDMRLLKGTRDCLPEFQMLRESARAAIVSAFTRYGYSPVETPILNFFDLLSSKYAGGAEILKETYKLSDQGDRELALRYDLTVPFARLVGTYQPHQIQLPFKRYEIGKVFRDGPIKAGRFREFTQCDADVVGVSDVVVEAECMALAAEVFQALELGAEARVGHRQLLAAILSDAGLPETGHAAAILSLDKLEKIGRKGVEKELAEQGVDAAGCDALFQRLDVTGTNEEILEFYRTRLSGETAKQALDDIARLLEYARALGVAEFIRFVPSLARGLEIYTGIVFEFFLLKSKITSSIGAGGRYDRMVGRFLYGDNEKKAGMFPTVGFSFGLDVIAEALREKAESENDDQAMGAKSVVRVLIAPMVSLEKILPVASRLRGAGISTEIAYGAKKLKKALNIANRSGIPFVAIIGEDELESGVISLRDMSQGEQESLGLEEAIDKLRGA